MEDFLTRIHALSSAEDFLQFFGIPFDPAVVNVSRLHILKRFFQYLRQQSNEMPLGDEIALFTTYRNLLARAYGDFVKSTPAQEKVFKVFQEAGGRKHVSVDHLKASLTQRAIA